VPQSPRTRLQVIDQILIFFSEEPAFPWVRCILFQIEKLKVIGDKSSVDSLHIMRISAQAIAAQNKLCLLLWTNGVSKSYGKTFVSGYNAVCLKKT